MSAPNILNPTAMYGYTTTVNVITQPTQILSNAADSGQLIRVISLYISNVDALNTANVSALYYTGASLGGTNTEICKAVTVPTNASLVVIDKNAPIYIEENKSLAAVAGANNLLKVVCSYEVLS